MSKVKEIKQVTKVKNEGRQKAGHKLVEWNRKNKEDLKKNQKQEPTQDDSSVESSEISTVKSSEISTIKSQSSVEPSEISTIKWQSNDTYIIGVGILSIIAIGLLVYFKMPSKSESSINKKKPIQQKIIRKML